MNGTRPATFIALSALVLVGCITSQIKGYTDPAYQGSRYSHIVVNVPSPDFASQEMVEQDVVSEFSDQGVQAVSWISIFPPTRHYSLKEISKSLQGIGVDAGMVILPGGATYSDDVIGFQSFGSAHSYGESTYGSATTIPMRAYSSSSNARIELIDLYSGDTVWIGDADTSGEGLMYSTDEAHSGALAKEIVRKLKEAGHI